MAYFRFRFERLEDRSLLATTIAFSPSSGLLRITGDVNNNLVQVDGVGTASCVQVSGAATGAFCGVRSIRAALGAGNDTLKIISTNISGGVSATMGNGIDSMFVQDTAFAPTSIGGDLTLDGGGDQGDRIFVIGGNSHSTIGGNVTLSGCDLVNVHGNGTSHASEIGDLNFGGSLSISTSLGLGNNSFISLGNVNVARTTSIRGTSGADLVTIENCAFVGRVTVSLGAGDDTLRLGTLLSNGNAFFNRFIYHGGSGTDRFEASFTNSFAFPASLISVEVIA